MLKLKKLKAEAEAKKALEVAAQAKGQTLQPKQSAGELILQKGARNPSFRRRAFKCFNARAV